ncbi:MAG: hypothetical protein CVU06_08180 [Bacteroidetes bacterium HGW-Bacteroidetes-22]|nr:MAG: hypothetical protein CVU06_08180 [Bacteroidetes bacterium HGW-Bacteroidetes-22]
MTIGAKAGLAGWLMVTVAALLNEVSSRLIGFCRIPPLVLVLSGAANQNSVSFCPIAPNDSITNKIKRVVLNILISRILSSG